MQRSSFGGMMMDEVRRRRHQAREWIGERGQKIKRFSNVRIGGKLLETPAEGGLNLINTRSIELEGKTFGDAVVSVFARTDAPTRRSSSQPGQPQRAFSGTATNLLANASFERGLTGWSRYNPDGYRVAVESTPARKGAKAAKIFDRSTSATGIQRDITSVLEQQGPGPYTYAARIKGVSGKVSAKLTIRIEDSQGVRDHPSPDVEATPNAWHRSERTQSLESDRLVRAVLIVESGYGERGDFLVDACWLSK